MFKHEYLDKNRGGKKLISNNDNNNSLYKDFDCILQLDFMLHLV